MITAAKNYFLLIFVVLTSIYHLSCVYLCIQLIERAPLSSSFKKLIYSHMKVFGHHAAISMLGFWFKRPIFLKYNKEVKKHSLNLVISNHCSDYDWLFVSHVFFHLDQYRSLYIMMKRSLSQLPIIGRIMRSFRHLFLNRSKKKDISIINQYTKEMLKEKEYNILIFPEGTYPYQSSLEHAKTFAKNSNLIVNNKKYIPERVLVPRKLGFDLVKKGLKNSYEGLIDVTLMVNPYMKMPSEECSIKDFFINERKFINEAILVDYIPKKSLHSNFLIEDFSQKDKILDLYSSKYNGEFKNIEDFKKFLQQSNLIKKDDVIEEIHMKSPWRFYFLLFPYILLLLFFGFKMAYK